MRKRRGKQIRKRKTKSKRNTQGEVISDKKGKRMKLMKEKRKEKKRNQSKKSEKKLGHYVEPKQNSEG